MDRQSSLPRYDYYKGPQRLGDLWTLSRDLLTMQCVITTHAHGWELRLTAGTSFSRVQVCKTEKELFDTSDAWQAQAKAQGWT